MSDFRQVTETFAVAPQIAVADLAEAARRGFALVINNRPDGEAPDQPPSAEMAEAAKAAGLAYKHIPVRGMASPDQVAEMAEAVSEAGGPVLAFCRSGTRSITTWALGEAAKGRDRAELARLAAAAGYDLAPVLGV